MLYTLFYKIIHVLLYKKGFAPIRNILVWIIPDKFLYNIISKSESLYLLRNYKNENKSNSNRPFYGVVMMFDGNASQPGLADCLRGIASVYYLCKTNNIPFKVYYKHPFNLSDFLIPNEYDWVINDELISYNKDNVVPVVCTSYSALFGDDNPTLQKEYLLKKLKNYNGKQIHLYTNTYCYDEHFYYMFHELFRMSSALEQSVSYNLQQLGDKYISASFRFAMLLGDLKDTYGTPLPAKERESLIQHCINAIKELHNNNPMYKKILITTDSVSFADKIQQQLPYVYVIPGEMGHLAYNGANEVVLKTLLDLIIISKAETVYMIRTNIMYRSGFAKRAALIGNKPFVEVLI